MTTKSARKLIGFDRLCEKLGGEGKPKSRQFVYDHEADADFPKAIWIGRNRMWFDDESDAYIEAKAAARGKPPNAGKRGPGRPRKQPEQAAAE